MRRVSWLVRRLGMGLGCESGQADGVVERTRRPGRLDRERARPGDRHSPQVPRQRGTARPHHALPAGRAAPRTPASKAVRPTPALFMSPTSLPAFSISNGKPGSENGHVKRQCELCTADPGRPFLVEEWSWAAHCSSKQHRRHTRKSRGDPSLRRERTVEVDEAGAETSGTE